MTAHRPRRWFQLSLKSLFLLVLLVATFLAGYSLTLRQRDEARAEASAARAEAQITAAEAQATAREAARLQEE